MSIRVDLYLSANGYSKSRTSAQKSIREGCVEIDGVIVRKESDRIDETREHNVKIIATCPYVSRGGLKLEAALNAFSVDVRGLSALDIGASTGGFTDCLLQHGASKVCALENGSGQLDEKLRNDPRVYSVENVNARHLNASMLPFQPSLVVMDVSFISQTLILPVLHDIMDPDSLFISLVKPQFEVGRQAIGKGGIVKDEKSAKDALLHVIECAGSCGIGIEGYIDSPIPGGDGNKEYLIFGRKKSGKGGSCD